MGGIGGIIDAFDEPGVSVQRKVKNKKLQKLIDESIDGFSGYKKENDAALSDYISKYLAGAGAAKTRSDQEIGAADDFYNGNMANRLQALRTNRATAINNAADIAGKQAIRTTNQARVGSDGSGSSYDRRLLIGALAPIKAQAAVDNANQERSDLGYVTEAQMKLAGERNRMANSEAAYGLIPAQARTANYQSNIGTLGNLGQLDQLNTMYGLKQDRNQWANFADAADQGIMNAASIYSSVAGGGGMKDGGMVRRPNYETGGEIQGPGTGTSDSVPINASNGEFVMPEAAMRIPGVLPLLEYIRRLGLQLRGGAQGAQGAQGGQEEQGEQPQGNYADGGMIMFDSNIGNPFDAGFNFGDGAGAHDNVGFSPGAGNWTQMQGGQQQQKKSGGGGGLAAGAQGLQAREDRSHQVQNVPNTSKFGVQVEQGGGLDVDSIMQRLLHPGDQPDMEEDFALN